jgi:hypothetical protein
MRWVKAAQVVRDAMLDAGTFNEYFVVWLPQKDEGLEQGYGRYKYGVLLY